MKRILICCAFPWLLISCNTAGTVVVDGITAKSSNRVGGKGMIHVKKGTTEVTMIDNNEASFRDGISGAKWIGAIWGGTNIADTITKGMTSTSNAKTAASVSNTAAKEVTKQSSIQATTDQAKIAAEADLME